PAARVARRLRRAAAGAVRWQPGAGARAFRSGGPHFRSQDAPVPRLLCGVVLPAGARRAVLRIAAERGDRGTGLASAGSEADERNRTRARAEAARQARRAVLRTEEARLPLPGPGAVERRPGVSMARPRADPARKEKAVMRCRSMPRRCRSLLVVGCAVFIAAAGSRPAVAQVPKTQLKIATVAPEGSPWMQVMREIDTEIRQ